VLCLRQVLCVCVCGGGGETVLLCYCDFVVERCIVFCIFQHECALSLMTDAEQSSRQFRLRFKHTKF
jgi:hypothetical protein